MRSKEEFAMSRTGLVAGALLASLSLVACGGDGGGGEPSFPAPTVSVSDVIARDVTPWDEFSGRIEAIERVELRPRVSGYLDAVHFSDGAEVEQGQLLFTIDSREFEAAVASARAELVSAEVRVEVVEDELARSERLVAAKAVSTEEVMQRQGEARQARADVQAAQARLDQAELQLDFTRITAPIAGRLSLARVRPGNLVGPADILTTLVSIDPIYVEFEGDERVYLRYQDMDRDGLRQSSRDKRNPVRVGLSNEDGYPHLGEMVFVDNVLDPRTGTIKGRAILDNANRVFTPGLFARVQLLGSNPRPALLIHDQAVLTDQDRKYVYVVGEDGTAQRRDVKLGDKVDGLRMIEEGLDAGESVVVNGTRRIYFPGMAVAPVTVPMDDPDQASSAARGGQPSSPGGN